MVCVCGHKANRHDYNRDWKIREKCRGQSIPLGGMKFESIGCGCSKFTKQTKGDST